jgi:hypothetical protein
MAAAGTAVRPVLTGPAHELVVVAATPHAAYLAPADAPAEVRLALLSPHAVRVPLGVVLPVLPPLDLADVVAVGGGAVEVAGARHQVLRWVDTEVPRVIARPDGPAPATLALLGRLVARVGEGPGLTPEADDVLGGALAALHARAAHAVLTAIAPAVTAATHRTTPVSAALLRCALAGHAVGPVHALVHALARGDVVRRRAALDALARVGHTSGPALARGVLVLWNRAAHHREVA